MCNAPWPLIQSMDLAWHCGKWPVSLWHCRPSSLHSRKPLPHLPSFFQYAGQIRSLKSSAACTVSELLEYAWETGRSSNPCRSLGKEGRGLVGNRPYEQKPDSLFAPFFKRGLALLSALAPVACSGPKEKPFTLGAALKDTKTPFTFLRP